MVSSGLSGLAAVMVEMTVPGQRRMALTPATCPITDQMESKKGISKSSSTIASEAATGDTLKEPVPDGKRKKNKYSFFDSRKTWRKSLTDNPISEVEQNRRACLKLASSPNLSTLDYRRGSDVTRHRLNPQDVVVHVESDGKIDGADLFSSYDKTGHSSDQESVTSHEQLPKKNGKKSKRKGKEKVAAKLSLSDRNIPQRVRNGSVSSPFFKRLVSLGRTKSNKALERTVSIESDNLLGTTKEEDKIPFPRGDSSINIFITDAEEDGGGADVKEKSEKKYSNGRHNFTVGVRRSISLMQSPFTDSSQ